MYLNPFTALPFGSSAAGSIAVDKGTSLYDLIQAGLALRGPQTGTVPIANANLQTPAGDAVQWDTDQGAAALQRAEGRQARPGRPAERHQAEGRDPLKRLTCGNGACAAHKPPYRVPPNMTRWGRR